MDIKYKGREGYISSVDGDVGEGAWATEGGFLDGDMEDFTDTELEEISDMFAAEIYDEFYQIQVMRSEAYFEGDR